ncbi:BTB/POZ domain-containing protein 6-A [Pseudolycoriella hygida]|uniref:BTB/POZ domain-containing protein 6-A n=1 Tax=Pseudolycoriella hygida TaxID=35572 RepID=A0A9Q0RWQ7_9DIPT|nr:BTB/POZ domain-containing protein 6-A [Pseudolycoriella hygida]
MIWKQNNEQQYPSGHSNMSNHTLSAAISKFYLNPSMADIFFKIETKIGTGEWESIPSHKFLLAAISDVFCSTFDEKKEINDFNIGGTSPTAFKEFLRLFYFDEVILTSANAKQVIVLAKKFNQKSETFVPLTASLSHSNRTSSGICART